jgi:UDP-N-acetylmuramoyl-L-alanyl-D-glutamate--2,6-diaminopimelate ligase
VRVGRVRRPDLPPGPYLVAGLARAGSAAVRALLAVVGPDGIRAWDQRSSPKLRRTRGELKARGVRVELGGDGTALLEAEPRPRCMVKSPGIAFDAPIVVAARERDAVSIDELELGWRLETRPLVAITGTNGKSTTAALAQAVLRSASAAPALAGNTLFGPPLAALAHDTGDVVVCEVSSYQLEGCPAFLPEAAVFTNLTEEHLRRHGSLERYAACKRRLFVRGDASVSLAVVNVDDAFGRPLADDVECRGGRVVRYGSADDAEYRIEWCDWTPETGSLLIRTPDTPVRLETRLPGPHNALSATAAVALADAIGIDIDHAARAVEACSGPPGRFEPIHGSQPFDVIVDYAHNADGIRCALETARHVAAQRPGASVRAVAGTVSIESVEQRRSMGRLARELADDLVLTTERWHSSDPTGPPEGFVQGARGAQGGRWEVVADRRAAIERALRSAEAGDIVMILGRGAGSGPIYDAANQPCPFDDRVVAREILERLYASTS